MLEYFCIYCLHIIVIISIFLLHIFSIISSNGQILLFALFINFIIIFQWYILGGRCSLDILEEYYLKKMKKRESYFKIPRSVLNTEILLSSLFLFCKLAYLLRFK